jgi:hypothetical protein
LSSSTTRSPGIDRARLARQAGGLAEAFVEEDEAAVDIGEREADRERFEQGMEVGAVLAAEPAGGGGIVEHEKQGLRLGTISDGI